MSLPQGKHLIKAAFSAKEKPKEDTTDQFSKCLRLF